MAAHNLYRLSLRKTKTDRVDANHWLCYLPGILKSHSITKSAARPFLDWSNSVPPRPADIAQQPVYALLSVLAPNLKQFQSAYDAQTGTDVDASSTTTWNCNTIRLIRMDSEIQDICHPG